MPDSIDPNNLPPELRGVPVEQLQEAIKSTEKARKISEARDKRLKDQHDQLIKDGQAIDLIAAAKRCYQGGNSGTEQIAGY